MGRLWIHVQPDDSLHWWIDGAKTSAVRTTFDAWPHDQMQRHDTYVLLSNQSSQVRTMERPESLKIGQIKKSLPFLLEQDCLVPIEQIHCLLLTHSDTQLSVFVTDKVFWQKLQGELNHCASLKGVYPLAHMLPHDWSVFHNERFACIKTPFGSFQATTDMAALSLEVLFEKGQVPDRLALYATQGTSAIEFSSLIQEKIHQQSITAVDDILSPNKLESSNLVSDVASQSTWDRRVAKQFALVGCLFLSLGFIIKGYHWYQLDQAHQALQSQIAQVYFEVFPQAKRVVAPRVRMEQRLQDSAQSDSVFLSLLGHFSQAISQQPINIEQIKYTSDKLTATIKTSDYQQVETLRQQLSTKVGFKERSVSSHKAHTAVVIELTELN